MKLDRVKNAQRNMKYGVVLKIFQLIIPFFIRTLMIYQMGIEYAGLNNLFLSIFQFLNLAELGIGAALTMSMYKPIADNNEELICALLKLYRTCFNLIGIFILILGLLLMPFLDYLVVGEIPDQLNLRLLYFLYLINTTLSYWLFSYKKSLLFAHQRNDVNSKITILTQLIQSALQVIIIIYFKNFYLYVIATIFSQAVNNIISSTKVTQLYPNYRPEGKLSKDIIIDIKKKVKGLFTNKIGGVILRSSDSIVISSFLGLTTLAIYQNYYFILNAVIAILAIFFEGLLAGIGNSLITENLEKNYNDLLQLTFITCWISSICCACFLLLYQPFITLWVGNAFLLDYPLVISLVVYFYFHELETLIGTFKDAAGIWYSDRLRPIITASVNLFLNIIFINKWGLYGVLWSTVISVVIVSIPWIIYNVFNNAFIPNLINDYIKYLVKLSVVVLFSSVACGFINFTIVSINFKSFLFRVFLAIIIPNFCMFFAYRKSPQFHKMLLIIRKMLD